MFETAEARFISMSYWLPILQELSYLNQHPIGRVVGDPITKKLKQLPPEIPPFTLRVPDTVLVHYPYGMEMGALADGKEPRGWNELLGSIEFAAEQFGYPVFLRTDQSSDKHSWKSTCFVSKPEDIDSHVGALVEHSMLHDLPCDFFAVRRMIPTKPIATTFHGEMPVAMEWRVFIKDGDVICSHPYWPEEAFKIGNQHNRKVTPDQINELQHLEPEELKQVEDTARYVSQHMIGAWSIDFLRDVDGNWWCIDMALAGRSYHWAECKNASSKK